MLVMELPPVNPPADAPPPDVDPVLVTRSRRRPGPARVRAALMVLTIMVMVSSLGIINSAPARAWVPIAIGAAKGIATIGASIAVTEGFEMMTRDGSPDSGGDSDDDKRKRGKWGNRLKGLAGLASGLLGAAFTLKDGYGMLQGDGDGVGMPDDFAEDIADLDPLGSNHAGYRTWSVLSVEWLMTKGSYHSNWSVSVNASCAGTNCPSNNQATMANTGYYQCFNPTTGGWWVSQMGIRLNSGVSNPPCGRGSGSSTVADPVHSVIIRQGDSGSIAGFDRARQFFNPEFDAEVERNMGTVTAETTCVDGSGGRQTVTKTVPSVGDVMPIAACPAGWFPESIGWTGTNTSGESDFLGGVKHKTPESMPDCPPGQCTKIITVDGEPCSAYRPECYDWMNLQPPSRVKCEYGPYALGLAECGDLEHAHKTTWGLVPDPRPDAEPQWIPADPGGGPDWTKIGTGWVDDDPRNPGYRVPVRGPLIEFVIGNPGPENPGNPNPDPPGFPPGGPFPDPPGDIVTDPETGKNCLGGMWSWNPVDWVFTPVKCALTWAFVPPNGSIPSKWGQFRDKFTDSGIGPWLALPPVMFADLPEGGGG
ncbi:hypothetical protein ACWGLC_17580, partial [Dietzia sp. NPDC055877]